MKSIKTAIIRTQLIAVTLYKLYLFNLNQIESQKIIKQQRSNEPDRQNREEIYNKDRQRDQFNKNLKSKPSKTNLENNEIDEENQYENFNLQGN